MSFAPLSPRDIPRLERLWLQLHRHHQELAPELAPYVSEETSWALRSRQYREVLEGGGFGFIASDGAGDRGYLLCARRPMQWQATFPLPPMLWELVSIYVEPRQRGSGLGSAMLRAMEDRIAVADTPTKLIGLIPQNRRAAAFYQARGYVPAWLTLTRFRRPAQIDEARMEQSAGIALSALPSADVGALEPLWLELHHHHQAVSPGLRPFLDDARSWPVIAELFEKSAKDGLLFVAHAGDRLAGLASAAIYDVEDLPGYADTWVTGGRIAETKFLVVRDAFRGRRIGAALMDRVEREIARRGAHDHFIGAIEPNASAIRFYQSRGFRPAWLELLKTG
ncbi:MAG TPA: GNAT family N-acetyltransferase [Dongiaceae bacterium]